MKNKIEFLTGKPYKLFTAYEVTPEKFDLYVEGLLIKMNISKQNLEKLIDILK